MRPWGRKHACLHRLLFRCLAIRRHCCRCNNLYLQPHTLWLHLLRYPKKIFWATADYRANHFQKNKKNQYRQVVLPICREKSTGELKTSVDWSRLDIAVGRLELLAPWTARVDGKWRKGVSLRPSSTLFLLLLLSFFVAAVLTKKKEPRAHKNDRQKILSDQSHAS